MTTPELDPPHRAVEGLRTPSDPLAGIDVVVFDKDGTLIDFHAMWTSWVDELADRAAEAAGGRRLDDALHEVMGLDVATGRIRPDGGLAATPMVRLRAEVEQAFAAAGLSPADASRVTAAAWHAPDPVALAAPVTDLPSLFRDIRAAGHRIAVATSDDREPTERTLEHLGIAGLIDALACADDGHAVKPSPDAVHWICGELGASLGRTAVVGDSPADLEMGRSAGVALVVGVMSGVGDVEALAPLADLFVDSVESLRPRA